MICDDACTCNAPFPKPFLYLLGLKVSGVMVDHIQDTIVVLNKQLDGVLILKHELVGYLHRCLTFYRELIDTMPDL